MSIIWDSGRGRLGVEVRSSRVVVMTYSGHVDGNTRSGAAGALEVAFARTSMPEVFVDVSTVTAYTSDVRIDAATWWEKNLHHVSAVHVLTPARSQLVSMAIEVLNLALEGAFQVTRDPASFERQMAKAMRLPRIPRTRLRVA